MTHCCRESRRKADTEFQYRACIVDTDIDCGPRFCGPHFRDPFGSRRVSAERSFRRSFRFGGGGVVRGEVFGKVWREVFGEVFRLVLLGHSEQKKLQYKLQARIPTALRRKAGENSGKNFMTRFRRGTPANRWVKRTLEVLNSAERPTKCGVKQGESIRQPMSKRLERFRDRKDPSIEKTPTPCSVDFGRGAPTCGLNWISVMDLFAPSSCSSKDRRKIKGQHD